MLRPRPLVLLAGAAAFFIARAADLSPLAPSPQWQTLDRFQQTITRDEFVRLAGVYAPKPHDDWLQIGEDAARVLKDKEAQTFYELRFAKEKSHAVPRHFWRPIEKLAVAPKNRPLAGLRVALDPGHIGGKWAKMEERWYQLDNSKPVEEGEMTLVVAKHVAQRLRELGAIVSFVRSKTEPVTPKRPDDFRELARKVLAKSGAADVKENYSDPSDPAKEQTVQWQSELLFYRQSEIRYRARRVNTVLHPDLVLCLHFNAEPWGDPKNVTLVDANHFHTLVNGSYQPDELAHDDQRFELVQRLLSRAYDEELAVADAMAATFARETRLPPFEYTKDTVLKVGTSGYVYARNLLATRLFRCPVIYFEPYVMNSHEVFTRIQAGDYEGERDIAGTARPSIFREYAKAVADGLEEYCRAQRKLRD